MASLPGRQTASFFAIQPIPSATPLDDEFNAMVGASGYLKGGSTGTKFLFKSSDASDPPLEIDQVGAGPLAEWKQNGVLKASIENDGDFLANGVTGAAGVYTFGSIPVGPASNPTTDNELARKKYVDDRLVPFSLAFRIDDPSTFPLTSESALPLFRVPAIVGGFISKIVIIRPADGAGGGGSHTAGGSVTFAARIFNGSTIGSGVSFDDTNNAGLTPYTEDFTDTAISEGQFLTVHITARSGTVSERNVSINIEGYRKLS